MKTSTRRTALASTALLLLLGGTNAAIAAAPQQLSLSAFGAVTNLGTQQYTVNGGYVAFAMIAGHTLDPTATIRYSFAATQAGFTTKGIATLQLTGTTGGGTMPVSVSGTFDINSIVPAAAIPLGCTTKCNSELPFFFVTSPSNVKMTIGGSTQTVKEALQIESPYFNPGGAPIVIASADNAIVIAAFYTQGTIQWTDTNVSGSMAGALGTTPASGTLTITSNEFEDLVAGTATDSGTMSFSSMTPSFLNDHGFYTGTSVIPQAGATDCSSLTGIPGTCTQTGFQSAGQFHTGGIVGTYSTSWGVPALGFSSAISATVRR